MPAAVRLPCAPPICEDPYLHDIYVATTSASSRAVPPYDGYDLHQSVPGSLWCVTRRDIADFRRLVSRVVQKGVVTPTATDDFDPKDDTTGPSIFTVNEQVIKPVTAWFGDPSWALMLHPEGLECDLFVTHCWNEGVFEVIDKVLHSWPRGARSVYCCFLSNPQNLDIGGIISQPSSSPFAQALRSARFLLVVPNCQCSVYTRIWCIYEAFNAHMLGTPIFTATTPIRGLISRRVLGSGSCAVTALFGFLIVASWGGSGGTEVAASYLLVVVISVLLCVSLLLDAASRALRWVNDAGAMACGTAAALIFCMEANKTQCIMFEVLPPTHMEVFWLFTALFFVAREADRLWDLQAAKEAFQLQQGYTGRLQDAASSVSSDRERILSEIRSQHLEDAVEHAIGVLIKAGMSTPHLRAAASQGVDIQGAGWWSLAHVVFVITVFIAHPLSHALANRSCRGALFFVPWLKALEGILWVVVFRVLGKDQRGFAAAVAIKLGVVPYYTCWGVWVGYSLWQGTQGPETNCLPDALGAFVMGPLMLGTSAMGLGLCASLPLCGRCCANELLDCRLRCWRGLWRGSKARFTRGLLQTGEAEWQRRFSDEEESGSETTSLSSESSSEEGEAASAHESAQLADWLSMCCRRSRGVKAAVLNGGQTCDDGMKTVSGSGEDNGEEWDTESATSSIAEAATPGPYVRMQPA